MRRRPWRASLFMGLTYLSGRPGLLLTSFVLLAYVGVALAPFRWAPPRRHANAAAAGADGIRFPSAGLAHSAAPPSWLERAAALGTLRLELRFRTYALDQDGPSRIFTVSRDLHFADLTVGQEGSDLLLLLRRPGSAPNGKPAYAVPGVFRGAEWRDVEVTIAPGALRIAVDGQIALDAPLPERPLAGWNRGHLVALGNELNGLRPWRGEIARAVVDVDGERIDYARPGALEVPDTFWSFANTPRWLVPDEIDGNIVKDWAANLGAFVLLGFLLGTLGGRRGSWRRALAVGALASLGVEMAQGVFSRHPDSIDWALNTAGAAVGAGMARWLIGRVLVALAIALIVAPSPADAMHRPVQGFGALATGGTGHPRCVVESLGDRGAGTLRQCLARGNRYIVFGVAGTIWLSSTIDVPSNVTIDGFSAPPPGITVANRAFNVWNTSNIVLQGFRIRDVGFVPARNPATERGAVTKEIDCISVRGSVQKLVVSHMSIAGCGDGAIDIVAGPKDVTIQWSILSAWKGVLLGSTSGSPRHDTERISMHHTLMICHDRPVGCDRFPLIRASGHVVTVDLRHNVFEGWIRANGTKIESPAWVNVVGNAYVPRADSTLAQRRASLAVNPEARVFSARNVELGPPPRPDLNDNGNEAGPMPAPAITEREAGCVVRDAGVHPRDAVDAWLLSFAAAVPRACPDALSPAARR
jgi:pectate lyase